MTLEDVENLLRTAINMQQGATPGRYALVVSPDVYVTYDSHMQKRSGGTVAFPLMFGSFTIETNLDFRMGTAVLMTRRELSMLKRRK